MSLDERIYRGPVIGVGFSGQAGSAFPVLGILRLLRNHAAQQGRDLRAIFAFDPASNPTLSPIITRLAQRYGLETAYVPEIPIPVYRQSVDSGTLRFYGPDPDLKTYLDGETRLLAEYAPSLVISLLRPTLYFSREAYFRRTGKWIPYTVVGYGLLLGDAGRHGIPANFVPVVLPRFLENMLDGNRPISWAANRLLRYKMADAGRYMKRYLPDSYRPKRFPSFQDSLLGDVTLVPSSPTFVPGKLRPGSHVVGSVEVSFPLTKEQSERQQRIIRQLRKWKEQKSVVVFVAMGTTGQAFPRVLTALKPLVCRAGSNIKVLFATTTLGHDSQAGRVIADLEECDAVIHSDWFDLQKVMPLVDLVVNHGGLNTMETALYHDIPLLVVAPQQAEQGLNALIMRRAGLGEIVWGHRLEDLTGVLLHMITHLDRYRSQVIKQKAGLTSYYDPVGKERLVIKAINAAIGHSRS